MKQHLSIHFFLFSAILTLPFAGAHVFLLGVPIYMPELMVIFASAVFLHTQWRTCSSEIRKLPRSILWSTSILFIGLVSSAFFNGITMVQLGIVKSWFFFPAVFGWLIFQQSEDFKGRAVLVWYATLVATAIIALSYFFDHDLTYDGRLKAFYLSPNYLALFLFPGVFLGWHFIFESPRLPRFARNDRKSSFLFIAKITPWITLCAALYLTLSYTVIIASLVGFFLMLFLRSKRSYFIRIALIAVCSTIISLFLLFQMNGQKFSDLIHLSERSSLASRITIWQSSWKMLSAHPVTGIGPGSFQNTYLEYQKYFPPYLEWAVPHPHNLYLAFWLQTGIIGLIGFISLVVFWIRNALKVLGRNKEKTPLQWTLIGIMTTILLIGLLDTPYWKNDLAYSFWLLLALGL